MQSKCKNAFAMHQGATDWAAFMFQIHRLKHGFGVEAAWAACKEAFGLNELFLNVTLDGVKFIEVWHEERAAAKARNKSVQDAIARGQ